MQEKILKNKNHTELLRRQTEVVGTLKHECVTFSGFLTSRRSSADSHFVTRPRRVWRTDTARQARRCSSCVCLCCWGTARLNSTHTDTVSSYIPARLGTISVCGWRCIMASCSKQLRGTFIIINRQILPSKNPPPPRCCALMGDCNYCSSIVLSPNDHNTLERS